MKYSLFCDADKPGEVRKETDVSIISFIKLENMLTSFLHDSSAAGEMIYEMRRMISYDEFLGRRALLRDLENEKAYRLKDKGIVFLEAQNDYTITLFCILRMRKSDPRTVGTI